MANCDGFELFPLWPATVVFALRPVRLVFALLAGILIAGCNGPDQPVAYPVEVRVLLHNGNPLPRGRVTFRSAEHDVNARGVTDENGVCQMTTYEQGDGAVLGQHQVAIGPPALIGDPDEPQPRYPIPRRVSSFQTSGLEAVVTDDPAQNKFEFQVPAS